MLEVQGFGASGLRVKVFGLKIPNSLSLSAGSGRDCAGTVGRVRTLQELLTRFLTALNRTRIRVTAHGVYAVRRRHPFVLWKRVQSRVRSCWHCGSVNSSFLYEG